MRLVAGVGLLLVLDCETVEMVSTPDLTHQKYRGREKSEVLPGALRQLVFLRGAFKEPVGRDIPVVDKVLEERSLLLPASVEGQNARRGQFPAERYVSPPFVPVSASSVTPARNGQIRARKTHEVALFLGSTLASTFLSEPPRVARYAPRPVMPKVPSAMYSLRLCGDPCVSTWAVRALDSEGE